MRRLLMLASVLALLVSVATPAEAAVWRVGRNQADCGLPCHYHDGNSGGAGEGIAYGMSLPSTVTGDTVRVWPGEYFARIVLKSGVVLESADGSAVTTIVGSGQQLAGITLVGTGPGTVLDGFTITWNAGVAGFGGGIGAFVSTATVKNNVFKNCQAGSGAGIYLQSSDLTVVNNLFVDCITDAGAGIVAVSGGFPTIRSNTFARSVCPFGYQGAAFYAGGTEYVFDQNIVEGSLGGAAVYCGGPIDLQIECNIFWNNEFGAFAGTCSDSTGFSNNLAADPLFCDPDLDDFGVCVDSPALTGPCGTIGYTSPTGSCPACQPTSVHQLDDRHWAAVKALYRN